MYGAASATVDGMAPIVCTACGKRVPSRDVDLGSKLAKCECGEVFDITAQARGRPDRRELVPPPGLTVEVEGVPLSEESYRTAGGPGGRRVLTRRWFAPRAIFLAFFCVAWDSFLVFWYAMAFGLLGTGPTEVSVIMVVFPIAHVAVGVGLTYFTVALLLNRTTIVLDGPRAQVRHAPLPWPGSLERSLDGLDRVHVLPTEGGRRRRITWSVLLDDARRTGAPLVTSLESEAQARCIAAHVAAHANVAGR